MVRDLAEIAVATDQSASLDSPAPPRYCLRQLRRRWKKKGVRRLDLRGVPTYSVDAPGTYTFDDAISVSLKKNLYQLAVHVSDVASWGPTGSVVDRLAQYSRMESDEPGRIRFPFPVRQQLLSLIEGNDRLAITMSMLFDKTGRRLASQVGKSIVKVDANMMFDQAQDEMHRTPEMLQPTQRSRARTLRLFHDLGQLLSTRQRNDGLVPLHEFEAYTTLREALEAVMIETGFAFAATCRDYGVPVIYRRQDAPRLGAWLQLRRYFASLGVELSYEPSALELSSAYRKLVKNSERRAEVRRRTLEIMPAARDVDDPATQFALGEKLYVQLTSPIRRLVDFTNQQRICTHIDDLGMLLTLTSPELTRGGT